MFLVDILRQTTLEVGKKATFVSTWLQLFSEFAALLYFITDSLFQTGIRSPTGGDWPGYILMKEGKDIWMRDLSFWDHLYFNYLPMIIELLAANPNESIPVFLSF